MEIAVVWIVASLAVGYWNSTRGHSFLAGFFFSLLLSPVIAALIIAVRKPNTKKQEERAISDGDLRKCPACAELVKREAIKCKHCGSDLKPEDPPPPSEVWG